MGSLKTRSISGLVFLVAMIAAMWLPWTYIVIFAVAILIMTIEYFNITIGRSYLLEKIFSIIGCVSVFLLIFFSMGVSLISERYILLAFFPVIATCIALLYESKTMSPQEQNKSIHLFFPYIYIALPMAATVFLAFKDEGIFNSTLLLSVFLMIWLNDVGAYIFGMSFGQNQDSRKLFPSISPKKSWVGFWGGTFVSIAVSLILWDVGFLDFYIQYCVAIAIIVSVFGVYGDLFESLIKRHYGVKDAGKIMPGHG